MGFGFAVAVDAFSGGSDLGGVGRGAGRCRGEEKFDHIAEELETRDRARRAQPRGSLGRQTIAASQEVVQRCEHLELRLLGHDYLASALLEFAHQRDAEGAGRARGGTQDFQAAEFKVVVDAS